MGQRPAGGANACVIQGTIIWGAVNGCGTVFKITPGGTLTTLYSFCSQPFCTDGANPFAGLVQTTDGNFYGTTSGGGANSCIISGTDVGCGTVFKITPGGTLTTLHSFCSESGCTDGQWPYAGLVQATDGDFYGTTVHGGVNGYSTGTVFKITPSGTLTTLYTFCSQSGCTDGSRPWAGLVQASDGNLYGTAWSGGSEGYGTVFKITPAGRFTRLYSFCSQSGCTDGAQPYAGLVQGTDGNLYGTTYGGGANSYGTVFKITPGGRLTTLHSFDLFTEGVYPFAGLVQATDGNLYGTTVYGGAQHYYGTVFKITPGGTLTTLYSLCSQSDCTDGEPPSAGLVQDTDGNFYGTTESGGADGNGTIFSLSVGLGLFVETQPASGRVGEAVKILGTNLTGAIRVTFNRHPAVFNVVSSSLITTTVPAGATTGAVEVLTPSRTLFSNVPFRVPPSFSPGSPGGEGGGD